MARLHRRPVAVPVPPARARAARRRHRGGGPLVAPGRRVGAAAAAAGRGDGAELGRRGLPAAGRLDLGRAARRLRAGTRRSGRLRLAGAHRRGSRRAAAGRRRPAVPGPGRPTGLRAAAGAAGRPAAARGLQRAGQPAGHRPDLVGLRALRARLRRHALPAGERAGRALGPQPGRGRPRPARGHLGPGRAHRHRAAQRARGGRGGDRAGRGGAAGGADARRAALRRGSGPRRGHQDQRRQPDDRPGARPQPARRHPAAGRAHRPGGARVPAHLGAQPLLPERVEPGRPGDPAREPARRRHAHPDRRQPVGAAPHPRLPARGLRDVLLALAADLRPGEPGRGRGRLALRRVDDGLPGRRPRPRPHRGHLVDDRGRPRPLRPGAGRRPLLGRHGLGLLHRPALRHAAADPPAGQPGHRRRTDAVPEGRGPPGLVPRGVRLLAAQRASWQRHRRARGVPEPRRRLRPHRLLRAVRQRDGRDGAPARHPRPRGRRLPAAPAHRRGRLRVLLRRPARLARALHRRLRLGALRAHPAGPRRRGARLHPRGRRPRAARAQRPQRARRGPAARPQRRAHRGPRRARPRGRRRGRRRRRRLPVGRPAGRPARSAGTGRAGPGPPCRTPPPARAPARRGARGDLGRAARHRPRPGAALPRPPLTARDRRRPGGPPRQPARRPAASLARCRPGPRGGRLAPPARR